MKKEMKLSEAMEVGAMLKQRNPNVFLGKDHNGNLCGCAIGGASLAMGYTGDAVGQMTDVLSFDDSLAFAQRTWHWLRDKPHVERISDAYHESLEAAVDYTRRVEMALVVAQAERELETVEV